MISYDWRRCPFPSLEPGAPNGTDDTTPLDGSASWPFPPGTDLVASPSGPISNGGPMTGYGPLQSDLQRFLGGYGIDPSKAIGGIGDLLSGCWLAVAATAGVMYLASRGKGRR